MHIGRRLARVVALVALLGAVGTTTAAASSNHGTVQAAQVGKNPFTDQNVFCKPSTAPSGSRNASSPGVTPSSINIVDMSIDAVALRRFGSNLQDFSAAYKAYWDEINKCGGINGRKIVFKTAKYNPVAPDMNGHLQALCLKATEDYKAFVVVGVGPPQVQRCVAVQHKSIFMASTGVLDSEFAESKGRVITFTPGGDASARAFIKDLKAQNTLKGKTVGILGANNTSTAIADQQRQYVDGFKKAGVDVAAYEVLPCTGTVCTQNVPQAINRLKAKDVDVIVITQNVSITTIGSIWREIKNQNFKVQMWNAYTDSLNGDSTLPGMVQTAGSDGANFAESNGWYTVKLYDVQNAWRVGQAKETPFAQMCTSTLAASGADRKYNYTPTDIQSGRWGGTVNICAHTRSIASAIWSLGNNVTTERMVKALRDQVRVDYWDTSLKFRDKYWFMDGQTEPTKAMTAKFAFPCPAPTVTPNVACFLPTDRPARVRSIP